MGSRTLKKKFGFSLSPATIRNTLADLEDAGYLTQPHTSAGRVPTLQAFRYFVGALMELPEPTSGHAARISAWLEELRSGTDIVRESGRLLSELTGAAAVAARPRIATRTLRTLRFIPTRVGELLAVVVFTDGAVENRYVALDVPLERSQLDRLHNVLEELVEGQTLESVREQLEASLVAHRDELGALHELGISLVAAASHQIDQGMDIIIEGQSRALDNADLKSAAHARALLRTLEDRERLVALIDQTLASTPVQVFFEGDAAAYPVSFVAAPYQEQAGQNEGVVGVIGPARMNYPTVMPLVGATARAMTTALTRARAKTERPDGTGQASDDEELD